MPTKPIDRLLFAQGGQCFFCKQALEKVDASVEHLVAQAHGGKDNDENLVACCKSLNRLLGSMSLKEKLDVVLKQRGAFSCPARSQVVAASAATPQALAKTIQPKAGSPLALVVDNLRKRGNSRPLRVDKLVNTIRMVLEQQKLDGGMTEKLMAQLRSHRWISVDENRVTYSLPTT